MKVCFWFFSFFGAKLKEMSKLEDWISGRQGLSSGSRIFEGIGRNSSSRFYVIQNFLYIWFCECIMWLKLHE